MIVIDLHNRKWLRENHKIDINAYPCFVYENHYNYEILVNDDYDNFIKGDNNKTTSYEEALEFGLKEALEFINI